MSFWKRVVEVVEKCEEMGEKYMEVMDKAEEKVMEKCGSSRMIDEIIEKATVVKETVQNTTACYVEEISESKPVKELKRISRKYTKKDIVIYMAMGLVCGTVSGISGAIYGLPMYVGFVVIDMISKSKTFDGYDAIDLYKDQPHLFDWIKNKDVQAFLTAK